MVVKRVQKVLIVALGVAAMAGGLSAQKVTQQKMGGGGSPHETVEWTMDGATITIAYGRPFMKGRAIFGDLVPYDKVWRTGADEATTLTTSAALMIGDLKVPAGTYTLYSWPSEKEWKLIVNKQTGQWGTQYDQAQDLGRVTVTREKAARAAEQFTMAIEGGKLSMHWADTVVSAPIAVQK